jgi:hypothetical protein
VAATYQSEGFTNVKVILGGVNAWKEAGYPVVEPSFVPGSTIAISGTGFAAGEVVDLQVAHIDGTVNATPSQVHWTTVADAAGAISTSLIATSAIVSDAQIGDSRFELTVTGETSHQAAFATFSGVNASATATVSTDRYDYAPGATAVISGSGFAPGETVALQVVHADGRPNTDASHTPWTVTADAAGNFQTTWTVDDVDAVQSTLDVHAVGVTSHNQADETFTDTTIHRPFWIFAHNPNTLAITESYINMGVNALEPDVEFFSDHSSDTVSQGFYIAHQAGTLSLSNYNDPTLSLHDYLDGLSTFLTTLGNNGQPQTKLSLVEFDVKTEACDASGALKYIVSTINSEILPAHPELYFLINAGSIADAGQLFTMKADDALAAIPMASRSHFGFSIDGSDDVSNVHTALRNLLGTDANIAYGDGSSGCCGVIGATPGYQAMLFGGPVIASVFSLGILGPAFATLYPFIIAAGEVAGGFIHLAPNVPTALQQAVYDRAAFGDFNMIAYGFSITGKDSMKMLIDSGVDGMIPADDLDVTSPFSIHGFNASSTSDGNMKDTQDALDLVNGGYGGTFMATTADDPFFPQAHYRDPNTLQDVFTGSPYGYALEVKTTDISIGNLGPGTDARLTFTLTGDNGSASTSIDSSFPKMMEAGDTNYVFIPSANLGTLDSITISEDGSGVGPEWNVDYINVRSAAYIGTGPNDFYHADYGGQDVGDPICIDFDLLGTLCFDTGDQNPSTRTFSNYLTGVSDATATGGVEGTTAATLAGATFSDRVTATTTDDLSVTAVNWGDGSTDKTGVMISGSTGSFTVTGSHLYTKEGSFAFSIQVTAGGTGKDSGNTTTIYGEFDVVDAAVMLNPATFQATEGTLSDPQTLATFTDPAGAEPLTDYAVDVDWGNGTFVSDTNVSISGPDNNGLFTVTGKHLYTDEDGYSGLVQVRIKHEATTPSEVDSVVSVPLTVTDPPANATAATGPFQATEGTMSAVQTLATFTDPAGAETTSDYTVDVDWGNGTFVSGDTNVSISGPVTSGPMKGDFTVTGQHLYSEEDGSPGPVRVRINHEGGTPSPVVSLPLTLTDPPLLAAGTTFTVVRGACPTQTVATFTDPGGAEPNLSDSGPLSNHYTATIHWGDGSPDGTGAITYNGIPLDDSPTNTFTVTGDHNYTTNGKYTITVTIHHEGAVPDAVVTTNVTVVSLLNHAQGLFDNNTLVIGAALSGSKIRVVPVGKQTGAPTDTVRVLIDGMPQINTDTGGTTFTGFNSITIYGQAGKDDLEVAGKIKKNTAFFGGGGNDRMRGGAGNDIMVGGAGKDLIIAGSGQDILIGGGGHDHLVSGPGGDVLIAGSTDFDDACDPANAAILNAIQAAWTNPNAAYKARAAAVLALFSTDGSNGAHIHYDGGTSKLTSALGDDLDFQGFLDPKQKENLVLPFNRWVKKLAP